MGFNLLFPLLDVKIGFTNMLYDAFDIHFGTFTLTCKLSLSNLILCFFVDKIQTIPFPPQGL